MRGRDIGFLPTVEGGVSRGGRLFARDEESILLEYDLGSFDYEDIQSDDLRRVSVELSVANDYRIEMASDLQTDGERRNPEIVFLTVDRAQGNVEDNSNTRVLSVDYGLPTATELIGLDWNVVDWGGVPAHQITFPGFIILDGSRAFFKVRIRSISTSDL